MLNLKLSTLADDKREKIISSVTLYPFTEYTITDEVTLREEIGKINKQGYAYSHGEWLQDASGVAAPIFGSDGNVMGALTISGPSQRFHQVE